MVQQEVPASEHPRRAPFCQISRRSYLAGLLGLGGVTTVCRRGWAMQPAGSVSEAEKTEIAAVQVSARKAGLGPFSLSRTDHFLGLGDADDRFRENALAICESLAADFLKHFGEKGFKLALPEHRLTVITLKDDLAYQAYSGNDPGSVVGGHYDLDTNRLVMFDFRPKGNGPGAVADPLRVNLMTLVHETTHLLCFNTGLLSRKAEVPNWVSEGLATYAEMWSPANLSRQKRVPIGAINRPWLDCLKISETPRISLANLIASDKWFGEDDKTAQMAYAESWLLVHFLLKKERKGRFQAYLEGLPGEGTASQRIEYAEKHLGSLKNLDRELGREIKRLSR
jgi:hypothetical protein